MDTLSVSDAMLVINKAIHEVGREVNADLAHYFTSPGKIGYHTEIEDRDVKEKLVSCGHNYLESIFAIDFAYSVFTDEQDTVIDGPAGVNLSDSTDTKAFKRCCYFIKKHWEEFKKTVRIVDNDFLASEVKWAVNLINKTKPIHIIILSFKTTNGWLEVDLTEDAAMKDGNKKVLSNVLIDKNYYLEDESALDGLIGIEKFKDPKGDGWLYNGRLRVAYTLFYAIVYWLKAHHPELLKEIKGKK